MLKTITSVDTKSETRTDIAVPFNRRSSKSYNDVTAEDVRRIGASRPISIRSN